MVGVKCVLRKLFLLSLSGFIECLSEEILD